MLALSADTGADVHVTAIKRGFFRATDYLPQQSFLAWTGDVVLDEATTSAVICCSSSKTPSRSKAPDHD